MVWRVSRGCLNDVWKVSGSYSRCLEGMVGVWKVSGKYLKNVWKISGRCLEVVFKVSGKVSCSMEVNWQVSRRWVEWKYASTQLRRCVSMQVCKSTILAYSDTHILS